MSATPRPWRVVENQIWAGDAESLALVRSLPGRPPTRAQDNADLIVRAINAFDALLAVAKAAEWATDRTSERYCQICGLDPGGHSVECLYTSLDTQHPGWREWTG